jgi:hypothetical protein
MGTRSRTYLASDWQIWLYKPVAGKFRLDFSALNGSDVLGAVGDTGSFAVMPFDITGIQIDDGQRPEQGVFFTIPISTMSFSAQLDAWSEDTAKELYNGKKIFVTLKNENSLSDPIFGKNTVFFMGQIDSLNIEVDPINRVTNLTVTATDFFNAAMNTPMRMTKSTVSPKSFILDETFLLLSFNGLVNPYVGFLFLSDIGSTYETSATETKALGEWLNDYIDSEVAYIVANSRNYKSGPDWFLTRYIELRTIKALSGTGRTIPESVITGLVIAEDGANSPTSFELSNSSTSYSYGISSQSVVSNPNIYSQSFDVASAYLKPIADKITEFVQALQPIQVTVKTAQTYQTLVFDNTEPYFAHNDYSYPVNFWINGEEVKTSPSFTGKTYNHMITGTSHTITPDDWQTTYTLWKGL